MSDKNYKKKKLVLPNVGLLINVYSGFQVVLLVF